MKRYRLYGALYRSLLTSCCLVVFIKLHIAYLAVGLNRYDCVLEGSLIRLSLNIVLILSNTLTEGSLGTVKL